MGKLMLEWEIRPRRDIASLSRTKGRKKGKRQESEGGLSHQLLRFT